MFSSLLKPLYKDVKTFILDTLFPITCISCNADGLLICEDCKSTLKKIENQRCIVCQKQAVFGITHKNCQTKNSADGLVSFYNYHDEKIAKIIITGKYKFIPDVFKILGQMVASKINDSNEYKLSYFAKAKKDEPTINYQLVPIPLHPSRLRWRGFNQSEVLAGKISELLNIPCTSVLVRCKLTKTQKDLNKADRQKNLKDAFKLTPNADMKNKNIILIDDVTTTGSTLNQAAKILKQHGAAQVICLTVARD
jgi:ComF family protein